MEANQTKCGSERRSEERPSEKVLFLMAPDNRHLVVELDRDYTQRELNVLLTAFRKRLVGLGPDTTQGERRRWLRRKSAVNRIVGPGFVIEMLGARKS